MTCNYSKLILKITEFEKSNKNLMTCFYNKPYNIMYVSDMLMGFESAKFINFLSKIENNAKITLFQSTENFFGASLNENNTNYNGLLGKYKSDKLFKSKYHLISRYELNYENENLLTKLKLNDIYFCYAPNSFIDIILWLFTRGINYSFYSVFKRMI